MSVLVIGLGGLGTVAAYTLQKNTEVTAVIRSEYENIKTNGYTINSIDYGKEINYKPTNIVKDLDEATKFGPFDHIVVSTKVIPGDENIWDKVKQTPKLFKDGTNIILIQNGVNIEKYWDDIKGVNIISGVSYISSIKTGNIINHVGPDEISFGLFKSSGDKEKDFKIVSKFVNLYTNEINKSNIRIDDNVRFIRLKKLLYNASFNTICCLINSDVGILFKSEELMKKINLVMKEIQLIANNELKKLKSDKLIENLDIENMIKFTEEIDAPVNYEPSMLVDFRNGRMIEAEVILGNLIDIHKLNGGKDNEIPLLEFIFSGLQVIQYKLKNKL